MLRWVVEEREGRECFLSCFNYMFRAAAGSWALDEHWCDWFWKCQDLSLSCSVGGGTSAGDLIFPIYTMELCEKKRDVDILGCLPFVVTKEKTSRSCKSHPRSKAGLEPGASHSPVRPSQHMRENWWYLPRHLSPWHQCRWPLLSSQCLLCARHHEAVHKHCSICYGWILLTQNSCVEVQFPIHWNMNK